MMDDKGKLAAKHTVRVTVDDGRVIPLEERDPVPSCCFVRVPGFRAFHSGVYIGGRVVLTCAHGLRLSRSWGVGLTSLFPESGDILCVDDFECRTRNASDWNGMDLAMLVLTRDPPFPFDPPELAITAVLDYARSSGSGLTIAGFGLGGTEQEIDESLTASQFAPRKRFGEDVPIRRPPANLPVGLLFNPDMEFIAGPNLPSEDVPDVCPGDSGGPAYFTDSRGRLWLVGIASRNIGPGGDCGFGSIYTRIDAHLDWIHATAKSLGAPLP